MPPNPSSIDTAQRPFVLVWELTQACDLACKHCRADAKPDRHPSELSTAEGKALLDQARSFGPGQLVVLSGGDPLVRSDVCELVEYGSQQDLLMTLTPSGTNSLTPERIDALADAGLRRLALSLDGGSASTHDEFRQEVGSFRATLRAARYTQEIDLPLQINTTVCAETVDYLPAVQELVADLDAVLWSVFFLVPIGRGTVLDSISPTRAEAVMQWLARIASEASFGVKTTEAPHYRRVAFEQNHENPAAADPDDLVGRQLGITAGDGFLFVSHTGDIYPSGFLPKAAGSFPEDSIVDTYRHASLFESLRDPTALKGKCGACQYRGVCGGSRSRAFASTGDPLASDPLCAYVPPNYTGPLPDISHP